MTIITNLLVIFCNILTSAHFLRRGEITAHILFLIIPFLLFFKSKFTNIIIYLSLAYSTLMWTIYALQTVSFRITHQIPYMRLIIIMSSVICLTVLTMILFYKKSSK